MIYILQPYPKMITRTKYLVQKHSFSIHARKIWIARGSIGRTIASFRESETLFPPVGPESSTDRSPRVGLSQGCCSKAHRAGSNLDDEWEWVSAYWKIDTYESESRFPRSFHPPFCSLRSLFLLAVWFIHVIVGGRCAPRRTPCTAIHVRHNCKQN